ncbi:MAG: hypothetical protein K1060chlam5_00155 [Candidatus Anoxychlamydiales bacterium]|nr:hypothetical protein [Candidatus Anoxychlamydiales bacterium]
MNNKELTKLCPNCDGCVALEVTICPYCGSSIFKVNDNKTSTSGENDVKSLSAKETLDSLYPPPYSPRSFDAPIEREPPIEKKEEKNINNFIEKPKSEEILKQTEEKQEGEEEEYEEDYKSVLLPTILFFLGVNVLIFSIILIAFSRNGALSLEFSSKYWFVYSLFAVPLVFFGYRKLSDL